MNICKDCGKEEPPDEDFVICDICDTAICIDCIGWLDTGASACEQCYDENAFVSEDNYDASAS